MLITSLPFLGCQDFDIYDDIFILPLVIIWIIFLWINNILINFENVFQPIISKIFLNISIILLILISIVFSIFTHNYFVEKNKTMFPIEQIRSDFQIKPPVSNTREAVEVLKKNNQIDFKRLEEIETTVNDIYFMVNENSDGWTVQVETIGIVPSFSCMYAMDFNGKPIKNNDYIVEECGWNK